MNINRVKILNNVNAESVENKVVSKVLVGGNILYKMSREHRVEKNWSLIYAQKLALENEVKLFVIYTHYDKKWECVSRTVDFILDNFKQIQKDLFEKNISFEYVNLNHRVGTSKENNTSKFLSSYCIENNIGLVVTDMAPQREQNCWQEDFLSNQKKLNKNIPLHVVDSRNIIPIWITSDKQEFAARTIRTKIYKKIEGFVMGAENKFIKIKKHIHNDEKYVQNIFKNTDWVKIRKDFKCIESDLVFETTYFLSGEAEAKKVLNTFLKERLENYDTDRNVATLRGQSNLSPYITFGMISKQDVFSIILDKYKLEVTDVLDPEKNGSGNAMQENQTGLEDKLLKSIRAFVEELVIRGDLTDNYVYHNNDYDNFEGLADWAKLSLNKGRSDKREYLYDLKDFEKANTHDTLWNAAQNEMMLSGKMHGYMRMYWAKKILEWTKTPEEAIETAIYLNDKYNLDGWCPNGFAGILWSIGGLHDRAWFPRPVYNTIRYMAVSGCEKKFDIKEYKNKWNQGKRNVLENKLF